MSPGIFNLVQERCRNMASYLPVIYSNQELSSESINVNMGLL